MIDFIEIILSKDVNRHLSTRYVNFISSRLGRDLQKEVIYEKHHILPKAKDLFPEFSSFKDNPWNLIKLTPREHFVAHKILHKLFGGSQTHALHRMLHSKQNNGKITSYEYENLIKNKKQLLSDRMKNRIITEEFKHKMSSLKKDFYSNVENRNKQSSACKKPKSVEGRANIAEANRLRCAGKILSEETKKKISISNTGRIMSNETKLKLSVSQKGKKKNISEEGKKRLEEYNKNKPMFTCKHCSKTMNKGNYIRWHKTCGGN